MTRFEIDGSILNEIHDELSNYLDDVEEPIMDYEGRGMYGKKCVGWLHNTGPLRFGAALFAAIVEVSRQNPGATYPLLVLVTDQDWYGLTNFVGSGRVDSMGHRQVTYFPDLTIHAS